MKFKDFIANYKKNLPYGNVERDILDNSDWEFINELIKDVAIAFADEVLNEGLNKQREMCAEALSDCIYKYMDEIVNDEMIDDLIEEVENANLADVEITII